MRSLQSKLGSGLVLSLIAVFSLLWLLTSLSVQYLAEQYIASRMRHDAEMLLSTLRLDTTDNMILDESAISPVYKKPFSGHYYLITSKKQVISSRSLWDQQLKPVEIETGEVFQSYQDGPDKQTLLVLNFGFNKQGRSLTVTVAEDLNPVKQDINRFQTRFAIVAIVMLLLLVALQVFILRHSLKRLGNIRGELQALQRGEIDQLSTRDAPTELQPLVSEVNHLLGLMTQQLRRSRDALGDLAHGVKKPLTILQQLANKNGTDITADVKETLANQTTEINRITDRILKRARLAGHQHSGVRFSFSKDLPDLIGTLGLMYKDKTITAQVNVDEHIHALIDREDMLELLGNLLDNAYKWAKQTVRISIKHKSGLSICIEDDGPGADPEKLQLLHKRGVRLDESKQGHGLGLAIAADMVREYKGSLVLGNSEELGGFRVDITLPIAGE